MKTLVLIRHAHSPGAATADDFSRPLSSRGAEDAQRAGKWIHSQRLFPEKIISSPSVRTLQTIRHICDSAGVNPEIIQPDRRLYESTLEDYLEVLSDEPENPSILFLVGHNFTISQLLGVLSGNPMVEMTPATVAVLEMNINSWQGVCSGAAGSVKIFKP